MTHFLILVGSEREGFNDALAEAASAFLTDRGHTASRYAGLPRLPHYRQDLDDTGVDGGVDEFRRAVRKSDAVVFVTPEYNGGPSSLIKNALDTASRPRGASVLEGKLAAVLGATPSPGGAAHAREALQQGLRRVGAEPLETTFGVAEAYKHLDEEGYDDEILGRLHEFLSDLVAVSEADQAA